MKFVVISLFFLAFSTCQAQNVTLISKECSRFEKRENCLCTRKVLNTDPHIYLLQYAPEVMTKAGKECYRLDLKIFNQIISLDSLYYATNTHKAALYIPGFKEGEYALRDNKVIISLDFVNTALNSVLLSQHCYLIEMDTRKKNIERVRIIFTKP